MTLLTTNTLLEYFSGTIMEKLKLRRNFWHWAKIKWTRKQLCTKSLCQASLKIMNGSKTIAGRSFRGTQIQPNLGCTVVKMGERSQWLQ